MYDIRQFRPALYFLVILGISGFALATGAPGLWVFAIGATLLNAWLVARDRFVPLPRWAAGAVTVIAFFIIARQMYAGATTPIVVIGQFLVLLQLIKLYEQRANRDYAQLLVLSLLLMIAASINTYGLAFAMLLVIYLLISLYCCLLFHLKIEAERARAALSRPEADVNSATFKQDERYLSRSMRRLTAIVAGVSTVSAVVVFLTFPRGVGAGMLGQLRPTQTLTGFSDTVRFDHIAEITQNQEVIAYAKVWRNDTPIHGEMPLLLRGTILDVYNGRMATPHYQWSRSYSRDDERLKGTAREPLRLPDAPGGPVLWTQKIQLQPTGTKVLFAMAGVVSFAPEQDMLVHYSRRDGVIMSTENLLQPIDYTTVSTNDLGRRNEAANTVDQNAEWLIRARRMQHSFIDAEFHDLAMRPEISGQNEAGPLAAQRKVDDAVSPLDNQIAANIEHYLRTNFTYSLNLTDVTRNPQRDPLLQFLTEFKRGHCEYFAGAMTLLCQSLGMQARYVVGFRCDEYNSLGEYYIVRQSHAHAWVEVLTSDGWKTFDPTSGREADDMKQNASTWRQIKHFFNFLEYKWASSVVAYDSDTRDNLMNQMNRSVVNSGATAANAVSDLKKWANATLFWNVSSKILSALVGLTLLALVVAIGWFFLERYRMRQRAAKMGFDSLPPSDQVRLARQLGFYADLITLLERERIPRPRHLTGMEFADSLAFLPTSAFDSIRRLTRIFYRVRFGQSDLQPAQQRRLQTILAKLAQLLNRGQ